MSGVKNGGRARHCVQCIMKKNETDSLESVDNRSGAELYRIYSASEKLQAQF